ncbi:UNVERIFIED_CONTAM: hypothetical protein PYX00_008298 [Menopon gallinae]|uniref:Methyl-CpG-binding domain protein 5 n=1 Tax=Menopon gallinae TaxID=328185 RepID=A0AAW2HMJ3_9NEOP
MLVPTCQSSGSSEASDDSSISNISQPNYSNDSSAFPNAHLEFTAPIPVNSQNSRSYNHFQQKEYQENYMSVIQPENQIPRCDSSKSETTESTCSSLSSGSAESQSEENPVRLPVLVNPVINNNPGNNMYESNTQTSINTYSHHSQMNDDQRSYQGVYAAGAESADSFSKVNPVISDQKNNLVVVFPNRIGNQNGKQQQQQQPPPPPQQQQTQPEPSKFNRTQQRVQQQKIFGLINIQNQASRDKIAVPVQMIKLNNGSNVTSTINSNNILDPNARYIKAKSHNTYNVKNESNNGNISCATSNNFIGDNQAVMQSIKNSDSNNESGNDKNDENAGGDEDINDGSGSGTSQIQNTSESSVINTNYKLSTNALDRKENDCAMLIKETSDKCISQCSSDVNSSMLNSNSVYLVNSNQSDLIKNNCFGDSSVNSCLNPGSNAGNVLPVPIGWRRLLMDGSIVYLSPSNAILRSIEQVKLYLQTMGTCKCGLECPVNCHTVFNFNPKVVSRPWEPSDSELTRLCNHKRKAPPPCSGGLGKEVVPDKSIKLDRKEINQLKKKKKKHGSYSGVSVSQLLAQRDRALAAASRWPANGSNNFQNPQPNQYQNVQVCNQQQTLETFNKMCQDENKTVQYPCVNVVGRDGNAVSLNGQVLNPDNRTQMNFGQPQKEVNEAVVGYGQGNQEFVQNQVVAPRSEGVVMTPQGLLFPPNMLMHRPRSIPPWHQGKFGMNKKQPVAQQPILYERVPNLHQHMPPPTLLCDDFTSRKKHKPKAKKTQESVQTQPSFMDDPNAYLAQQTALLHSTISRPNFNINAETQPTQHGSGESGNSFGGGSGIPVPSNVLLPPNAKNNFTVRPVSQKNQNDFTPMSNPQRTMVSHQSVETNANPNQNMELSNFNNHVCSNVNCSDCPGTSVYNNQSFDRSQKPGEKNRLPQGNPEKSDGYEQDVYCKYEWRRAGGDGSSQTRHDASVDENPVTSSTEKMTVSPHQRIVTDSRPIQGGTISTSNGSPQPQSQGSPNFRQDDPSPKCSELTSLPSQSPVTGNVLISSSTQSPIAVPNGQFQRDLENAAAGFKAEAKSEQPISPNTSLSNFHQPCESPDSQKFKNRPVVNSTSSVEAFDGSEQAKNAVTSTLTQKEAESERSGDQKGNRFVRTMASGHTVSSNTITSVLAGKAQTATVTVNNNPTVPPTISLVNFTNQNVINVPITQKSNTKSPLEMVQSVVSSIQTIPTNNEVQPNVVSVNKAVMPNSNVLNNVLTSTTPILTSGTAPVMKAASNGGLPAGHIIVSNNAQYIVASNGIPQTNISGLKLNQTNTMPPMSASPVVTNATAPVTQVLPAVGVAQQVLGQPTVLVNTLPTPFVIQPGVMAVDTGLGHLAVATGNVLQSNIIENDALRTSNIRGLLSPDKAKSKKGNKKRKNQVASIVQMASPNNMIINQPFNQQNFAVSPGGSIQALTLVSSKHGGPAQIVMNNQNNFNQFNSQPQQINLLQPVNLASVPNFPAFQQFIVPGFGNMVMATDGTATILPDTNIGVQLQLQNVNGQNVLTPVQNTGFINGQGILTTPAGMLIRAPNQQKVIQGNSNPQFLSPNSGQFLVNQFQGQLSPLIATNLSPNQQIYTNSPPRQSPQEFIQIIPTSSAQNTTVVQQNTTIVQQQTTMVSNNQNIINPNGKSNFILNNPGLEKPIELQIVANPPQQRSQEKVDASSQHSVSTQTSINKDSNNLMVATSNTFCQTVGSSWNGSPPDTTTHSPVGSEPNRERVQSSPDSAATTSEGLPQAMVQYVSSSINESESDSDAYLLSGFPNLLNRYDGLLQGDDKKKKKNVVESSTLLQESGIQVQVDRNYASQRCQKSANDESVVSSHSDLQDKHVESQCIGFQEERTKHSELAVPESRSDDFDNEGKNEEKETLSEGDLVWGSVRGSSAWPGKLVGPITPDGRVMVRWFGGHISSPTRVNINQLQSLSQGLEAHHKASNKGRKNRKLNIELEAAIQEAMLELDKKSSQEKKVTTGRSRRTHR